MSFDSRATLVHQLHKSLLPLLNPIHLEYTALNPTLAFSNCANITLRTSILSRYSRLQEIEFKGMMLFKKLLLGWHFTPPNSYHLACLPIPSIDVRRVVRLHLSSLFFDEFTNAA